MISHSHPDVINNILWKDLNYEVHRLGTFIGYSSSGSQSAILLARNGFVYEGTGSNDDSVLCVFCLLKHKGWRPEDNISSIHQRLSPNCPLVTRIDNTNITFAAQFSRIESGTNESEEEDGILTVDEIDGDHHHGASMSNHVNSVEHSRTDHNGSNMETEHNDSVSEMINSSSQGSNPASDLLNTAPPSPSSIPSAEETETSQTVGDSAGTIKTDMTYSQLGIYTERPKTAKYSRKADRKNTFENTSWPENHCIKVTDLVNAGFHYGGYADCVRCFYCGGGLRNWEPNDEPIVEHAHWFPKCAFIRQTQGPLFIKAVLSLYEEDREVVSLRDVAQKLGVSESKFNTGSEEDLLLEDSAVQTLIKRGFDKEFVFAAAKELKDQNGWPLNLVHLIDKLKQKCPDQFDGDKNEGTDDAKTKETINELEKANQELKRNFTCKVCYANPITITFLPCGHFVSCSECAPCLTTCPVCRSVVKGVVRVIPFT